MTKPTETEIAAALEAVPSILLGAGPRTISTQAAPRPNETWDDLADHTGMAWVFYGQENGQEHTGLVNPVIMADGFNSGPSTLPFSWEFLEETDFPLISTLRQSGKDVIILGFKERSDSILTNSDAAIAAIQEVNDRDGVNRLVVGGFSMGGLVTRYALAKMEKDGVPHNTEVYFSYDSPHRGAYIPISLLAFAHFIRESNSDFSDQMNSDAAQQLLWQHIATEDDKPAMSEEREKFLQALQNVGNWPQAPRKLAVANGVANGGGNGIGTGKSAVTGKVILSALKGTDLRTMPEAPDNLAAILKLAERKEVQVDGLPAADGAPGGTMNSFEILADALNKIPLMGVNNPIKEHCFVPAVSAVDIRDLDTNDDLYTNINNLNPNDSGLDEYRLASQNEEHTKVTEELCTWLLDRF